MSIVVPAGSGAGLTSTTNLSNPQSCTKLIWMQSAATPTSYEYLLSSHNAGYTAWSALTPGISSGELSVSTAAGVFNNFGSQPTWTDWNCYAITMTTDGAGSVIGYWQDNSGGGFVSESITGASFTISNDDIANNVVSEAMTLAYYMEWNTVLTSIQLQAQFQSSSPAVALGSLRRYLKLANTSSAGTDTSGNGYNMTVNGTLTNGSSLPIFPSNQRMLLLGT